MNPNEWMPVLLFVIPDFGTSHVSTVAPEAGAFPPSTQTLLVEREVLPMLDSNIGDSLTIQTPNGTKQEIKISAADPLNLAGVILPGPRIAAVPSNFVVFRDGVIVRSVTARDTTDHDAPMVAEIGGVTR